MTEDVRGGGVADTLPKDTEAAVRAIRLAVLERHSDGELCADAGDDLIDAIGVIERLAARAASAEAEIVRLRDDRAAAARDHDAIRERHDALLEASLAASFPAPADDLRQAVRDEAERMMGSVNGDRVLAGGDLHAFASRAKDADLASLRSGLMRAGPFPDGGGRAIALISALRESVVFADLIASALGVDPSEATFNVTAGPSGRELARRLWEDSLSASRAALAAVGVIVPEIRHDR